MSKKDMDQTKPEGQEEEVEETENASEDSAE